MRTGCVKYRCVPKIASPEAPNNLYRKTHRDRYQRVRALRLVQGECTTAPQGHTARVRALSLVQGECTTAVQAGGEPRDRARVRKGRQGQAGGGKEEEEEEEGGRCEK